MKTIRIKYHHVYKDNRLHKVFDRDEPHRYTDNFLGSGFGYTHIDFEKGEIKLDDGKILQSGVPYVKDDYLSTETMCFFMEDDAVPCNEDTLYLKIECYNSANGKKQEVELPYRVGEEMTLTPYPYNVKVVSINNEEVEVDVENEKMITRYLVQLYNHVRRNDQWGYATGNPNDPYDTAGPILYIYLFRRDKKEE